WPTRSTTPASWAACSAAASGPTSTPTTWRPSCATTGRLLVQGAPPVGLEGPRRAPGENAGDIGAKGREGPARGDGRAQRLGRRSIDPAGQEPGHAGLAIADVGAIPRSRVPGDEVGGVGEEHDEAAVSGHE